MRIIISTTRVGGEIGENFWLYCVFHNYNNVSILNYVGDIIQLGDKVTFRFNHLGTQYQVSFFMYNCYIFVLDTMLHSPLS